MRECTEAHDFTGLSKEEITQAVQAHFGEHKLYYVMGLAKTGKSTLLDAIQPFDELRTMAKWKRTTLMDMIGGYYAPYNNPIERLEDHLFKDFMRRDWSVLCYEAFGRRVSDRKRLLDLAGGYPCALIVMDGPPNLLGARLKTAIADGEPWDVLETEADQWMKDQWLSTNWPSFQEGWTSIYYVTTYGQEGKKWLKISTQKVY